MKSSMAKRMVRWTLAGLAFLAVFPLITFAQQPEFAGTCRQALENYVSDVHLNVRWNSDHTTVTWIHNGVEYLCKCVAQNQPPVCNPKGSSGSGGSGDLDLSRFSPGEQVALTAVQSLVKGLFSGIFKSRSKGSAPSVEEALQARQKALLNQQEENQAMLEQWNAFQRAEEDRALREREDAREQGRKMLAQTGGTGGQGLNFQPISGEKLEFNEWAARKPEANPLPSGKYPAPKTALEQANCAAYFSEKARELAGQGKSEEAEFMSLQAQKAMSGEPLDVPCRAAAATRATPVADSPEVQVILDQYKSKVQELLEISQKLADIRKQKLNAEMDIQQADANIANLKDEAALVTKPEEKQKIDDLLNEAEALKSKSEDQLRIAGEMENAYIETAEKAESQVQELNSKLQESKVKK
jgi:hypothetical protein